MVIFHKKWKSIQLTKNKMDLNVRKMTNHPPSPVQNKIKISIIAIMFILRIRRI